METRLTRRQAMAVLSLWGAAPLAIDPPRALARAIGQQRTSSSYRLELSYPLENLVGDLEHGERGDARLQSNTPHAEWYSHEVRRRFEAWGPKPRMYAPLAGLEQHPTEWKRQRVIATAARFVGYGYQHHHLPDWNPPASWPWKETCVGHNGRGVDCSNLTSFVYNQGFGIKMNSAVGEQAELRSAIEAGGHPVSIRTVKLPAAYASRKHALRTGDLVYISGREGGPITHVVIWVGTAGHSTSGVPLVIDSHGSGVTDDDGRKIPCGVQLRPFREHSWYNRCASHAHRIFHDAS